MYGRKVNMAVSTWKNQSIPRLILSTSMTMIDKKKTAYVHCAGGYRSMIFNSILRARGYNKLVDVKGGFKAMKESGLFPITDYVCPTTLL